MDDKLIQKITKIKDKIDRATTNKSKAEGGLENEMKSLKEKDKINTIDDLSKTIDKKESLLSKLSDKLESMVQKLEKGFPWELIN